MAYKLDTKICHLGQSGHRWLAPVNLNFIPSPIIIYDRYCLHFLKSFFVENTLKGLKIRKIYLYKHT